MLDFDKSGVLLSVDQLVGRTIASVTETVETYTITFTDGESVKIEAQFDGGVFFVKPD